MAANITQYIHAGYILSACLVINLVTSITKNSSMFLINFAMHEHLNKNVHCMALSCHSRMHTIYVLVFIPL